MSCYSLGWLFTFAPVRLNQLKWACLIGNTCAHQSGDALSILSDCSSTNYIEYSMSFLCLYLLGQNYPNAQLLAKDPTQYWILSLTYLFSFRLKRILNALFDFEARLWDILWRNFEIIHLGSPDFQACLILDSH